MAKKKILFTVLILAFFLAEINAQQLTILHTNDLHSKLTGYGPESDYSPLEINNDNTLGGFSRMAAIISSFKQKAPDQTLILDAGDFLMGSLFHVPEQETGFQMNLMKKMGFDYTTFGNHEFDFGPEVLGKIIDAAQKRGGHPKIVASNLAFSKSADDDLLQSLFTSGEILPYDVFEKNGLKIGIFALVGIDAASVAPASKPVTFANPFKTAAKTANYLKKVEKVDIVILLSHAGIVKDEKTGAFTGEDFKIAKKAPEIDIIISAHTHVRTTEYLRQGKTYIVQTGSYGAEIGKIELNFTAGKISDFAFELLPVDDKIKGDETVQMDIDNYISFINKNYLEPSNLHYSEIIGKTAFDLNLDFEKLNASNLGPFIADGTKYYLNKTGNTVDISLVAAGTIRENMVAGKSGLITPADAFRVMSLGNGKDNFPGYPLAVIYITGREMKDLAEAIVMLQKKGDDGFMYSSGLEIVSNPKKGFLNKVQQVNIDGKPIDLSKKNTQLYAVSANTYLLSFIGRVKKMSFGLLKVEPKDNNGVPVSDIFNQLADADKNRNGIQEAKEWIALIEYIRSFEKNSDGIPEIPSEYRNGEK
jgi:5'-nucleotidase